MNNITTDGRLDLMKKRRVPAHTKNIGRYMVQRGDVLFNATNSPELVGKTAPVPKLDEAAVFSNHFIRLRPRPTANGRFISRWLNLQFQQGVFRALCRQWVNQATVSREALLSLRIPAPPLSDQRRVADLLDRADALRARRRVALAQLDTLTQAIFLEMFNDPRSNRKGWPRTHLPKAYWFQEGPGIRKWQFHGQGIKLLNVGNIERDGTLNLAKTSRHLSAEEANGKYRHFLVDAGDFVIASSGISFDDDGLLRTRGSFVAEADLPLCMNTSTIRFKAIASVSDLRFFSVWLNSSEFREQITKRVTGSAQQNFGPGHLSSLEITLPPLHRQQEFGRRVDAIQRLKVVNRRNLVELDGFLASLQYRAFRGEL